MIRSNSGPERYLAAAKPPPGVNPYLWILQVCEEARLHAVVPPPPPQPLGRKL